MHETHNHYPLKKKSETSLWMMIRIIGPKHILLIEQTDQPWRKLDFSCRCKCTCLTLLNSILPVTLTILQIRFLGGRNGDQAKVKVLLVQKKYLTDGLAAHQLKGGLG